jgi:hypothetical protein
MTETTTEKVDLADAQRVASWISTRDAGVSPDERTLALAFLHLMRESAKASDCSLPADAAGRLAWGAAMSIVEQRFVDAQVAALQKGIDLRTQQHREDEVDTLRRTLDALRRAYNQGPSYGPAPELNEMRETLRNQDALIDSYRIELDELRAWKQDTQAALVHYAAVLVTTGVKGEDGSIGSALDQLVRRYEQATRERDLLRKTATDQGIRADTFKEVNQGLIERNAELERLVASERAEVTQLKGVAQQKQRLIENLQHEQLALDGQLRRVARVAVAETFHEIERSLIANMTSPEAFAQFIAGLTERMALQEETRKAQAPEQTMGEMIREELNRG